MRSKLLFGFLMLFSASLFAQTTVWNPAANNPSDGLWSTTENWTNGTPTEASKAVFNVPDAMACKVNSTQMVNQIVQGDNGPGDTLIIADGGNLTTGTEWSAVGRSGKSTLIVQSGGTISFGGHFFVGQNAGGDANVILDGGTINVGSMFGLDFNGNGTKDTLFLKSGLLNLANIHGTKTIGDGCQIIITGGMIKIAGDRVTDINSYVDADKIIGADTVFFDTVANFTAVVGAPANVTKWSPMAGGTNLWTDYKNWTDFNVPDSNKVQLTTLEECIYDDTIATYVKKFVGGDGGEGGLLTVKNGSITTGPEWSAVGWTSPATLNVEEGAQFNFGQHMWIGWKANGPGTVNINGGTVTVAAMFGLGGFGTDGESVGIVNINSGTLELTQVHESKSIFDGSYINIEEGELIISRTGTDAMLNYVNDGKIIAYGGKGRVLSRLDGPNIVFYAVYYPDEAAVLKTSPKDGDVAVAIDSDIVIEFYNTMDSASVVDAITMTPAMANTTYAWDQVSKTTLTISGDDMDYLTDYSITIGTGAKDFEGNALAEAYTFSFETDTAPTYAVTFTVVDNADAAVEGATVEFQSATATTDADGIVVFEEVEMVTDAAYTVSKDGFEDATGTVSVVDADVDVPVTLLPEGVVVYNVTFTVTDADGAIEGAAVEFQSATVNTDADGVAVFENIEPVTDAAYTVTMTGYEDATGTVSVVDADVDEAVVMIPVGVAEEALSEVTMYPNPFTSTLTVNNLDKAAKVIISNVIGQVVLTKAVDAKMVELNTNNLENGIYLITIIDNNNNSRTERIVKN